MPRGIPGSAAKKAGSKRKYTKRSKDSQTESTTSLKHATQASEEKVNSQFDIIVLGIQETLGKELRPSQVAEFGRTFSKLLK